MNLLTGLESDGDIDNAGFFESNLLYQMISVVGWLILTIGVIVLIWVSEPCISRITARCKQPPPCVLEIGNVETILSKVQKQKLLKPYIIASTNNKDEFSHDNIVLPNECRERFVELQLASKEALSSKFPIAPVIFHGPSGTGKHAAATQLSRSLAIPYALVSGTTLAAESSLQIDALVSWANTFSRGNGILIFIEQADAFLSKDSREKLIKTFTGVLDGVRRDIFFILASRDAENIDRAVHDRCEQLQFSLPDAKCRRELLFIYFDEHVRSFINANNECASSVFSRLIRTLTMKERRMLSIDNCVMTGEALENIVAQTRGLSGRDIRDLMINLKIKLHRSENDQLTYSDVWETIVDAQTKWRLGSSTGMAEQHSIAMTNLHSEVDFYEVTVV